MPHTATKPSSASSGSVISPSQIAAGSPRSAAARSASAPAISQRREIRSASRPAGNREQDEGQRQRGLQQAGLAFADAEQQHRDDGRGGQRDLLGRLRGEVGPGEAVEGRGQVQRG